MSVTASIVEGFQAVVGRAANNEERLRLYALRDKLGIPESDPMWPVLYTNTDHETRVRSLFVEIRDMLASVSLAGGAPIAVDVLAAKVAALVPMRETDPQSDALILELMRRADNAAAMLQKILEHVSAEASSIRNSLEELQQAVERDDDELLDPELEGDSAHAPDPAPAPAPAPVTAGSFSTTDAGAAYVAPDAPLGEFDNPFGDPAPASAAPETQANPVREPIPEREKAHALDDSIEPDAHNDAAPSSPTVAAAAPVDSHAAAERATTATSAVRRFFRPAALAIMGGIVAIGGFVGGSATGYQAAHMKNVDAYVGRLQSIPTVKSLAATPTGRDWIDFGRRQSLQSLRAIMTCDREFGLETRAAGRHALCAGTFGSAVKYGWRIK